MGSLKDIIFEDSLVRASHVEHLQENLWEVELFAFSVFPKVSCRLSCVEMVLPVIPQKVLSPLLSILNEQSQALILRVDYCSYGIIHGTETLTTLFGDILFLTHHPLYCASISSPATIAKGARRWISLQEMCVRLLIAYPARPTLFRWKSLYDLARTAADALFPSDGKTPHCFHAKAKCVVLDVLGADTFVVQWKQERRGPTTMGHSSLSSSSEPSEDAIVAEPYPPVLVLRMTPCDGQQLEGMTVQERLALWWARRYIGQTLEVDIHTVAPSELDLSCNVYARQVDRRGVVEGLARGEDGRDLSTVLLSHRLATLREVAFPLYPLYLDVFGAVTQLVLHPVSERETSEFETSTTHPKRISDGGNAEGREKRASAHRPRIPWLFSPRDLRKGEEASTGDDSAASDTAGTEGQCEADARMEAVVTQIQSRTQLKPRALSLLIQFLEPEWWRSRCEGLTSDSLTRRLFHQYLYCGNYKAVDSPQLSCVYNPLRMVFPMHKLPQLKVPLRGSIKQVLFHLDPSRSSTRPNGKKENEKASDASLSLVSTAPISLYVQLDVEVLEHQAVWEHYMEKLRIMDPQRLFIWTPDPFDNKFYQEVKVSVQYTGVVKHATLFVHAKEYLFDASFRLEDHVVQDNAYTKVVPTVEFNGSFLEYSFGKFTVKGREEKIIIFDVFIEQDGENDTDDSVQVNEGEKEKREGVQKLYYHRMLYHLSPEKPLLVEDEQMGVECDGGDMPKGGGAHHDAEEEDVDDDMLQNGEQGVLVGNVPGMKDEKNATANRISYTESGLTMFVSTLPFFFRLQFPAGTTQESILHGDVFSHLRRWSAASVVCLPVEITRVHGILGFVGNVYFLPMVSPPSISDMLGDLSAFSFPASFQQMVTLLERAAEDMYASLHACWGETAEAWESMGDMMEVRAKAEAVREALLREKRCLPPLPTPPSLRLLGRGKGERSSPQGGGEPPPPPTSTSSSLIACTGDVDTMPTAVPDEKRDGVAGHSPDTHPEALHRRSGVAIPPTPWEWVDAQSPDYCPPTMAPYILPPTLPLISFSVTSRQLIGENHKKSKTVFSPAKDHPFPFVGHMDYYYWTRVRFPLLPNILSGHLDQLPVAVRNIERRYCAFLLRTPLDAAVLEHTLDTATKDAVGQESTRSDGVGTALPLEAAQDAPALPTVGHRGDPQLYVGEAAFARFMTVLFHLRAFTVRHRQAVDAVPIRTEYDVLRGIPEMLFHADDLSPYCGANMVLYRVPLLPYPSGRSSSSSSSLSWRLFLGAKDGTFSDVLELPAPHNFAKDLMFFSKRWMRRVLSSVAFDTFVTPPPLPTVPLPLPPPDAAPNEGAGTPWKEAKDEGAGEEEEETVRTTRCLDRTASSALPQRVHLRAVEGFGRVGTAKEGGGGDPDAEKVLLATSAGSRQVSGVRAFGYDRRVASRPVVYHPLAWLHVIGKPLMRQDELRDGVDVEGKTACGPMGADGQPSSVSSPSPMVDRDGPAHPTEASDGAETAEKVTVTQHILLVYRLIGLTVRKPYRPFSFSRFSKKFIHLELKKSWKELQFIQNWCSLLLHRSTPYTLPLSLPNAAPRMQNKHKKMDSPHKTDAAPGERGHHHHHQASPSSSSSVSSPLEILGDATPRSIETTLRDDAATPPLSSTAATGMLVLFGSTCCATNAYFATKRQLRRGELIPPTARSPSVVITEEEQELQEQHDLEDLANPIRSLLQEIDDACVDIPSSRFFLSIESSQPVECRPPTMLITVNPVEESNDGSTSLINVTWGSEREERAVYAPAVREDEEKSDAAALFPDLVSQAEEDGDRKEAVKQVENSRHAFPFAAKNPHRPFDVLDKMYEKRRWKVEYDLYQKCFSWERL